MAWQRLARSSLSFPIIARLLNQSRHRHQATLLPLLEIDPVLVRFDRVASVIVNANHGIL